MKDELIEWECTCIIPQKHDCEWCKKMIKLFCKRKMAWKQ